MPADALDMPGGPAGGAKLAEPTVEGAAAANPEEGEKAPQSMFRDIDTILARLENGIAVERAAMDKLLDRLTSRAA
jgi:hypothetical protein